MEKLFVGFHLTPTKIQAIIKNSLRYLKGEKMSNKDISELKVRVSELVDEISLLKRDLLKLREDVSADIKDLYNNQRQNTNR